MTPVVAVQNSSISSPLASIALLNTCKERRHNRPHSIPTKPPPLAIMLYSYRCLNASNLRKLKCAEMRKKNRRERERERERDTHTHTHTHAVTNTLTNNLKPGSERKKWLQNRSDCERAYYGSGDKSRTAARTVLLQLRCGTLLVRVVGESSLRNLFLRVRAKLFVFCAARVFFSVFFFRSRCQSERPGPWALHYWYLKNWHLNWVTSKLCHGVTTDFFLLFCDDFSPFWKRNSKKNNLSQIPCLKKKHRHNFLQYERILQILYFHISSVAIFG
jgi:hypothetical protein